MSHALPRPRGERQQGDVARLLDGRRKPALVRRADARQAARHDLAALGHELRKQTHVLVIDGVDLLDAELADFLAAEVLASAFTSAAGTAGSAARSAGTRSAAAIALRAVAGGTLRALRGCCCRRGGVLRG